MKILIVGGGGREHAIAWKLSKENNVEKIYCAPGNAGISDIAQCVSKQYRLNYCWTRSAPCKWYSR